ncbi:hypothetical protein ACN08X_06795 [Rothia sp. P6271]|uniref:hypothetical protein n=1 Tax=Rothia sp. P6271 TaxID=3402659 RepID=UPI003AC8006C
MADSAHKDWKEKLREEFNAKTDFDIISGRNKEKIDKAKENEYIKEGQIANAEFLGLTAMREYIKNKADEHSVSQYEVWEFLEGKVHSRVAYYSYEKYFEVKFWKSLGRFLLMFLKFPFFSESIFSESENEGKKIPDFLEFVYIFTQFFFPVGLAVPLFFMFGFGPLPVAVLFCCLLFVSLSVESLKSFLPSFSNKISPNPSFLGKLWILCKFFLVFLFINSVQIFILVSLVVLPLVWCFIPESNIIVYCIILLSLTILYMLFWFIVLFFVKLGGRYAMGVDFLLMTASSFALGSLFSNYNKNAEFLLILVCVIYFIIFINKINSYFGKSNSVLFEQYQQIIIAAEPPREEKPIRPWETNHHLENQAENQAAEVEPETTEKNFRKSSEK